MSSSKSPLPVSLSGRDLLRIDDLVPAEAEAWLRPWGLADPRHGQSPEFRATVDAVSQAEPEPEAVSTLAFALAIATYVLDSAAESAPLMFR